eukprot:818436-Pelagomonas_calceolata.AAC.2
MGQNQGAAQLEEKSYCKGLIGQIGPEERLALLKSLIGQCWPSSTLSKLFGSEAAAWAMLNHSLHGLAQLSRQHTPLVFPPSRL